MSTIKISELATSAISLTDFFAKADASGLANKNTMQGLSNFLNTVGTLAYRGVLLAADASVTLDGIYVAGDDGTYTNNGGLVITLSNQIVLISITETQTVFEKVEIPVSIVKDATPTEGSTNPVESGGVLNYTKDSLNNQVNSILKNKIYNSVYNGVDSFSTLDTDYTLDTTGDFVEFNAIFRDKSSSKAMGILGQPTTSNSSVGIFTNGQLYVRDSSSAWITQLGLLTSLAANTKFKIKLLWTATNIDVYLDGVFQKSVTKGTVILNNVGSSYFFFEGDVYNIKISHSGGTLKEIKTPFLDNTVFNSETVSVNSEDFSDIYISYDALGYQGVTPQFIVYTRNEKTNQYFGFEISRLTDLSDSVYQDIYNIIQSKEYIFDGISMTATGIDLLALGESESTYRELGSTDFTGGVHGDEKLTEVKFYIDGVIFTPTTNFNLKPCIEFFYIQKSNTFQTDNAAHPITSQHDKKTIIRNGGYETNNRYTWALAITVQIAYLNICSLDINIGEYGQSDNYNLETFNRDNANKLTEIKDSMHLFSTTNNISCFIDSYVDVNSNVAEQFIWDSPNYSKYYRDPLYNTNPVVTVGDIWNGTTSVKFIK